MIIKDLEYHKKELHKVSEQIKQIRKDSGLPKRSGDDLILYRLLQNYRHWVTRAKTGKNVHRVKYARGKIRIFPNLEISKAFHQAIIVALKNAGKNGK